MPDQNGNQDAEAALIAAQAAALVQLRARVKAAIRQLWSSLPDYRSPDRFVASVVPIVQAGQRQTAAITAAYLSQSYAAKVGAPARMIGVPPEAVTDLRKGVEPAEVYARPFHLVWRDLGDAQAQRDAHYEWTGPTEDAPEQPPLPPEDYVDRAIQHGQDRAEDLASTDLQLAKQHAALHVLGHQTNVTGYRRVLEGAYSCGLCIVAATQRYHRATLLPIHPGCVVGDTKVSATKIEAATRRSYADEIVIIGTASGNQLAVTPNHPVLTDHGWVPAGLLREGENVVSSGRADRALTISPDKDDGPSLISDVWGALAMLGASGSVPLTAEDFHGDGSDGEVDVVWTDRDLSTVRTRSLIQQAHELRFVDAWQWGSGFAGDGAASLLFGAGLAAAPGTGRPGHMFGELVGAHSSHAHLGSMSARARRITSLDHVVSHRRGRDTELVSKREAGFALDVAANDLWPWNPARHASRFDPASAQFSGKGLVVYADQGRRLLNRLAGKVSLDRVVSLRIGYAESGHVFNLQTDEGWYSANGFIVSNCDCSIEPIVGQSGREISAEVRNADGTLTPVGELPDVHARIADTFGKSSSAARLIGVRGSKGNPIHYRDAIITHENGELGPVLAVRGQEFTGPREIAQHAS